MADMRVPSHHDRNLGRTLGQLMNSKMALIHIRPVLLHWALVPPPNSRKRKVRPFIVALDREPMPRRWLHIAIRFAERRRSATVNAVVSRTREGSRSVDDFIAVLEGRLRSMASAHELLSAHLWQGVSLTELIRRELAPYSTPNNTEIDGPDIILKPEACQALAMVLHELATNAAKHGALSTKEGRVSIRWDRHLNGQPPGLALEWQEIGGPPIVAPGVSSYGTSIIRDVIPYELGGAVDLVLATEGAQCRLELPVDWLSQ
jgi:two-component sensor histidine kinase